MTHRVCVCSDLAVSQLEDGIGPSTHAVQLTICAGLLLSSVLVVWCLRSVPCFSRWDTVVPTFILKQQQPLYALMVPTVDTCR
jgi:hypothetical protein